MQIKNGADLSSPNLITILINKRGRGQNAGTKRATRALPHPEPNKWLPGAARCKGGIEMEPYSKSFCHSSQLIGEWDFP